MVMGLIGASTFVGRMLARFHDWPFTAGMYSAFILAVNIVIVVVLFSFPLSIAMQVRRARVGRPVRPEEKKSEVKGGDSRVSGHL